MLITLCAVFVFAFGLMIGRFSVDNTPQQMKVSCVDGDAYKNVDIMMVETNQIVIFTHVEQNYGQFVIPAGITCSGQI